MAAKMAAHQGKRKESDAPEAEEVPAAKNYNYLLKKDWDDLVLIEDDLKPRAKDFRSNKSLTLADLSQCECKLDFNPEDYDETQLNITEAQKHIKELLNLPMLQEFKEQRDSFLIEVTYVMIGKSSTRSKRRM